MCMWAHSSGGERLLDAQEVGGSKPPAPTIYIKHGKSKLKEKYKYTTICKRK